MMKHIIVITILLQFFTYGQEQVKITWPSLANSAFPELRGDMQGTGRSDFVGPKTCNIIWAKDIPAGVFRGPLIGYGDNLYFVTESTNSFYSASPIGQDNWTYQTIGNHASIDGAPILTKDSSICFYSRNDTLYRLKKDGSLQWKLGINAVFSTPRMPIDKNGNLYLTNGDSIIVVTQTGSVDKKIYLNKATNAMSFSTGGDTIYCLSGYQFSPSQKGYLNAIDLQGNVLWSYAFQAHYSSIPLVDNQNKVYVFGKDSTSQKYLFCIKPDGTLDWKHSVNSNLDNFSPSMDKHGNIVFYTSKVIDGVDKIVMLKLDYYGNEKWSTPLDGNFFANQASVGVLIDAEGKIYFGGSAPGSNFYCLDSNGVILWQYTSGIFEYDSCPAIGSDGTLYLGFHNNGSILCTNNLIAIKDSATVSVNESIPLVKEFQLGQNYPNPFNPSTTINYSIPNSGKVVLRVYNIIGKEVVCLVNEYKSEGNYIANFNASNLPSGVYFYTLQTGEFSSSKKMILIK